MPLAEKPFGKVLGNKNSPSSEGSLIPMSVKCAPACYYLSQQHQLSLRELLGATVECGQQDSKAFVDPCSKKGKAGQNLSHIILHILRYTIHPPINPCTRLMILITCCLGMADFPILAELVFKTLI